MTEHMGNEQNMEKVRNMMNAKEATEELNLGDKATNAVLIDYLSDYGTNYKGTVIFKRPNVMEFMQMGGIKSEIFRKAGVKDVTLVDGGIKYMAQVLATLKLVIVKCPEWLVDIEAVKDTDLLFHVHEAYSEWEDTFRKQSFTATFTGDSKTAE